MDNNSPFPGKNITIYTDGACNPNPGPGGWAAILLQPGSEPQELCGAEAQTSNNQMEMRAVLEALKSLHAPHRITLCTDSQYLRQGITDWLPRWEQRGWQTTAKKAVKNQELWRALAAEIERHRIDWQWVKGHAGDKWNERADELARSMLPPSELPLDDTSAIHIFAAASYLGKQKSGGWGVVLRYGEHTKTLSGHESGTSANRMHLTAAIKGLQTIKKTLPVHFYTNSDYVRDGITRWVKGWQQRNWQTKSGRPVSNQDLWQSLIAVASGYQVRWHLVTKKELPPPMTQAKALADDAARGKLSGEDNP
jgi:ribonuclease HI